MEKLRVQFGWRWEGGLGLVLAQTRLCGTKHLQKRVNIYNKCVAWMKKMYWGGVRLSRERGWSKLMQRGRCFVVRNCRSEAFRLLFVTAATCSAFTPKTRWKTPEAFHTLSQQYIQYTINEQDSCFLETLHLKIKQLKSPRSAAPLTIRSNHVSKKLCLHTYWHVLVRVTYIHFSNKRQPAGEGKIKSQVPKTAVLSMATWGRLQKQVKTNEAPH